VYEMQLDGIVGTLDEAVAAGTKLIEDDEGQRGRSRLTLDDLVAKVTPENLHGEIDMGADVGKET